MKVATIAGATFYCHVDWELFHKEFEHFVAYIEQINTLSNIGDCCSAIDCCSLVDKCATDIVECGFQSGIALDDYCVANHFGIDFITLNTFYTRTFNTDFRSEKSARWE